MAKAKGIDDISKAIINALKEYRGGMVKPTQISVNTGEGTGTRTVKPAFDNGFRGKTFIDSRVPIRMETYAKGSPEYKKAYKALRAKQAAFKKVNKAGKGNMNKKYEELLAAEARLKDWMNPKNFESMPADSKLVKKYLKGGKK